MHFSSPLALLLLVLIPAVAIVGWPRRGYGWRREVISLVLRGVILLALILALAGLQFGIRSNALSVVFLIDVSDSMSPEAIAAAENYTGRAIEAMGAEDQAAVIVFGGEALVDQPMSPLLELAPITSIPSTNQTDLAEAIRLAFALYPPNSARRLVILSDGTDTVQAVGSGRLEDLARLGAASGVEIIVLPFVSESGPEVVLSSVEAPQWVRRGERFHLNLSLESNTNTSAVVRVLAAGQVVYSGTLELDRGRQSFSLPLTAPEPGFVRYTIQIDPEQDSYYQNNELQAFSQVEGPPRVLIVVPPEGEPLGNTGESRPDEGQQLLAALEAADFDLRTAPPSGLPSVLAELAEYESIVLIDVPARSLSRSQMLALQSYVRDLGGGLVTIGGPTSYGVGGYFRTPLEETLPLEMQIKDEQRKASLTMVFIIDHSGSMAMTSGGPTKLDLAKEAAIRSAELLSPLDRVGVIAFDDSASWVVPLSDLDDLGAVINAIGSIRSGGGTDILAGLQAMAQELPADPSTVKHVILLTDGGANPARIPELVEDLNTQEGITISTVGVGQDAAPFLKDIAELGGGRYHFAADPGSIPSIFTEETSLATRSYIIEETFVPGQVSSSPILSGIEELPPLHGYVGTSAKSTAQTILISEQEDPILASWRYGLGKAVSFTSDATGRWGIDWVQWENFAVFWAQAVRSTFGAEMNTGLDVRVEQQGENANLVVEALAASPGGAGSEPEYLNGYLMQANVVGPQGEVETMDLEQTAPGRYETLFKPGEQGAYLLRISGQPPDNDSQGPVAATSGWILSYSPEYREIESNPDLLYRLAALTGGTFGPENPAEVFAHTLPAPAAVRPVWPWLLALAGFLLPLDIAVRRLALERADFVRAWERTTNRLTRRSRPTPAPAPRSQKMDALFQAKERSHREEGSSSQLPEPPAPTSPSKPPAPEPVTKPREEEEKESQEDSSKSTVSSLLAGKRQRQKKEE